MKNIDNNLFNSISQDGVVFEQSMNPLQRKQTGFYLTSMELTTLMMEELVNSLDDDFKNSLFEKKFLEPSVGTGNFVFAYLKACKKLNFSKENYLCLIKNIYVCDINVKALDVYKANLKKFVKQEFDIDLDNSYFDTHMGGGLVFDVTSSELNYISLDHVFGEKICSSGFDIVATNPPYKNLKAEKGQYKTLNEFESDKKKYGLISALVSKYFRYSNKGILNLYKLFVEEIISNYTTKNGVCSLLIPSSILSDKTCEELRNLILSKSAIKSLRLIPECSKYVDASQALCAILLHKGKITKKVKVVGSLSNNDNLNVTIDVNDLIDQNATNSILVLTENEYKIRSKMLSHPKIKDLSFLINMRGELDLTLNKQEISLEKTTYRLLRGRSIGYYFLNDEEICEYVNPSFVDKSSKKKYIQSERLICQQVVNMSKKRRVSFALIPNNNVLGNSCNFISIEKNEYNVDAYFLLGILNSTLIDWFFKLTSSNNHINNYEIDNFPIPIHFDGKDKLGSLVKKYMETNDELILTEIDSLVYEAYGVVDMKKMYEKKAKKITDNCEDFYNSIANLIPDITIDECSAILNGQASAMDICFQKGMLLDSFSKKVIQEIEKKFIKLKNGEILNHSTFKLSDLDLEMIKAVPQGGNWKNIPSETINKSKRLVRITQTGGRTTLYGRIDYSKPSYTITTYFNRPGNGTYVHPTHERVISVREAARFQSFPDNYYFYGNKNDMLKQVGNAVPVVLAYNIAKKIKEKTGCYKSVDLFSGAGGMTYGFKLAGIKAVVATDIIENACITLKINSPEIPVVCGDITKDETKDTITNLGLTSGADIICGGPPCQGFSLAGWRMKDDPRNELFRHFVDIVSKVNPKIIVFENVEGLLSFQGGETYRNIIELFSQLGYHTEGRKLLASNYGVPQKRKRVIILCTRKDLGIMPCELYPDELTPNSDKQITAKETIFDLESVECDEHAKYNSKYESSIIRYFKNEIPVYKYIEEIMDKRGRLIDAKEDEEEITLFDFLEE